MPLEYNEGRSSVAEEVADFDEDDAPGGNGRRAGCGRHGGRRTGNQVEIRIAVSIAEIDRGSRMQEIGEENVRRKLFRGDGRPAIETAEVGLQIEELGIRERGVVGHEERTEKLLRELVVQLRAHQMIVEDVLPGRDGDG